MMNAFSRNCMFMYMYVFRQCSIVANSASQLTLVAPSQTSLAVDSPGSPRAYEANSLSGLSVAVERNCAFTGVGNHCNGHGRLSLDAAVQLEEAVHRVPGPP